MFCFPRSQVITFAAPLCAQVTESDQSLGGKHVFASPRSRSGGEIKGAIVFEFPPRREGCDSGMEAFSIQIGSHFTRLTNGSNLVFQMFCPASARCDCHTSCLIEFELLTQESHLISPVEFDIHLARLDAMHLEQGDKPSRLHRCRAQAS